MPTYFGTLGMNEIGNPADCRIDDHTEAVVATTDTHNALHRAQLYNYQISSSAAASTSGVWFFFQTGASGTYESHMSLIELATSADSFQLYLYEYQGVSGSAGMSTSGFSASAFAANRYRASSDARSSTGNVTFLTGSGFSTASATLLDMHFVGGGTGVGGVKSGGTGQGDEEWALKPSGQYAFYFANLSACANKFNVRLLFRDYAV